MEELLHKDWIEALFIILGFCVVGGWIWLGWEILHAPEGHEVPGIGFIEDGESKDDQK